MKRFVFPILLLVAVSGLSAADRVNSTRKKLYSQSENQESVVDSLVVDNIGEFCEDAIAMRGYAKQTGAAKETFMLTNNTNLNISLVEITFRYTDVEDVLLHERTEQVVCDLPPYSSRQVSIKSFDEGKKFYYYKSKPRKNAVAYKVAIKVLRYDVKVERDRTP